MHLESTKAKPRRVAWLAGVWIRSTFCFLSGRPIGERRFNNRYYDNDANYDDVKKLAYNCLRPLALSQCGERELEATIGHKRKG